MLRNLFLKNFKAFAGEHHIPLSKITLIFGRNSAGKSSILQALLLLKQSGEALATGNAPVISGPDVDLVSMEHALYRQGRDRDYDTMEIGLLSDTDLLRRPGGVIHTPCPDRTGLTLRWSRSPSRFGQTVSTSWRMHYGSMIDTPYVGDFNTTSSRITRKSVRGLRQLSGLMPREATAEFTSDHFSDLHQRYNTQLLACFGRNLTEWEAVFHGAPTDVFPRMSDLQRRGLIQGIHGLRWVNPSEALATLSSNFELDGEEPGSEILSSSNVRRLVNLVSTWFGMGQTLGNSTPSEGNDFSVYGEWNPPPQATSRAAHTEVQTEPRLEEQLTGLIGAGMEERSSDLRRVDVKTAVAFPRLPRLVAHRLRGARDKLPVVSTDDVDGSGFTIDAFAEEFLEFHGRGQGGRGEYLPGLARILAFTAEHRALGITDDPESGAFYSPGSPVEIIGLAFAALRFSTRRIKHVKPARGQVGRFSLDGGETRRGPGERSGNARFTPQLQVVAPVEDPTTKLAKALATNPLQRDAINRAFRTLRIPFEIDVKEIKQDVFQGASIRAVTLTDVRNGGVRVGVPDVGFGIGQVLPLVAAIEEMRRSCLLIEQPELHLHPAMQAELGEYMARSVVDGSGRQIIAETHSEHLILRIMKLVRTNRISKDDIQIIYVDQDDSGMSFVNPIRLTDQGRFSTAWPRGFFQERVLERDDD